MKLGFLVRSNNNDLGIGKIIAIDSASAEIEYFSSVGGRIMEKVQPENIHRVKLESQTRCYLYRKENNSWQIGRIKSWDEEKRKYEIHLPDSKVNFAPESDIYVRCNLPIEDPIEILSMKGQETPYFHKHRSRFLKMIVQQRAISKGMTGLLSANIELYSHQVEVIRRVLEDPIQRYLLADEVGLGKTIEAGVILRQFLLDQPEGKALILVPVHLLAQWQEELENKFYLSQFPERVTLLSTEDWGNLEKNPPNYNFFLIDEAHHIAAMATSGDPMKRRCFQTCRRLAHKSKILLLLSAIPILNNEEDFLTMLHLLDPTNYDLQDVAGFREKVEKRQEIGKVLLAFQPGIHPFVLKKSLQNLRTLFSDDLPLLNLIDQLERQQEPAEIDLQISAIRNYISDTYRLHRRMLRNRRVKVEDVIFARNAVPRLEYDLDERIYPLYELLDEWRIAAPDTSHYQRIFSLLFRSSNTWLGVLKQVVEYRLKGTGNREHLMADFTEDERQLLRSTPYFSGEENILEGLVNLLKSPSEDGDRLELLKIIILYHLADILNLQNLKRNLPELQQRIQERIARPLTVDKFPKLVIFSSFTSTSRAIFDYLVSIFGNKAVVSHCRGLKVENIADNFQRFKNNSQCFLLVVDPSGEEGKNLQFVDGVIHFDLPFSPNQLEQRLGRVDRIGGKQSINSWLLAGIDSNDSISELWYQILHEGFNVFQHSIGSLQFYVEKKTFPIEKALFRSSANEIRELIEQIKQEIVAENVKNSEQNTLDEIDNYSEADYFKALESYDEEHKKIEQATESLLINVLKFRRNYDAKLQDVRRYEPREDTLIPLEDLKRYFANKTKNKGVYSRRLANQYSGVNLYRIGEVLIDTLIDYFNWDERGKAFAMWREEETWDRSEGGEWVGFRFDYLIELDWSKIELVLQKLKLSDFNTKALKRQGDALFPPLLKTVFLDKKDQIVEDESLLKILQRSYIREGKEIKDHNLAKDKLSILDQFIEPSKWENFCREARQTSEKLLRDSVNFSEYCQQHHQAAKLKLANRLQQLQFRYQRFSDPQLAQEIKLETALNEALLNAISYPSFRLDAVGFIIVSGRAPDDD